MGYVYSGTATACDLTLALFPIWLVWGLQMSKCTKAALVSILSMGCMYVLRMPLPKHNDADTIIQARVLQ